MGQKSFNPASEQCMICGGGTLHKYSAKAFDATDNARVSIRECSACSFAWQYPLGRDVDQSREFFESAFSEGELGGNDYFSPDKKRQIAYAEMEFAAQLPCIGTKLLDVGAGSGIFAQTAADAGWDVTAVDPALDCSKLVKCSQVRAVKGSLDDIANDTAYDVVTLWDVIEHVTDPVSLITQVKPYVREEGWLIIETGNFKSADRIEGGLGHWIFQLDHRWYFSPESIAKVMREAGFTELVFSQKVLRPNWNGSTDYAGPSRFGLLKSILRRPLQIKKLLRLHVELLRAKAWDMSGIGIFAVAGRRGGTKH